MTKSCITFAVLVTTYGKREAGKSPLLLSLKEYHHVDHDKKFQRVRTGWDKVHRQTLRRLRRVVRTLKIERYVSLLYLVSSFAYLPSSFASSWDTFAYSSIKLIFSLQYWVRENSILHRFDIDGNVSDDCIRPSKVFTFITPNVERSRFLSIAKSGMWTRRKW